MDRRQFLQACVGGAAALGLDTRLVARIAGALTRADRPPVVWLHFQECTGCTETLLRASHPSIRELLLELVSLEYHETLLAGAGHQAEDALQQTLENDAGRYILVVEGAIPRGAGGAWCRIGGRTALELLTSCADRAAALVAIGSCASFGGIPSSPPNPTGAAGVPQILQDRTVLNLPGCPPNPYNLISALLHIITFGRLPRLDDLGRPLFAYGRTIHEHCPRRPHFDAGRFAEAFGDEGHRQGWCLYKLGCKGPQTHASCPTLPFNDVPGAWPIGIGHPCAGCTEAALAFRVPMHETVEITAPTPSAWPAPMESPVPPRSKVDPAATGFAGLVGGVLLGAAWMAGRRLAREDAAEARAGEAAGADHRKSQREQQEV